VVVALSVANATALYTNLLRYTHGMPRAGLASLSDPEWWWAFLPVGPWAVFVVGSVAFAVLATLIVMPGERAAGSGGPEEALRADEAEEQTPGGRRRSPWGTSDLAGGPRRSRATSSSS
jgi:hypothetical protein